MVKRPLPVTLIAWLFIIAGLVGVTHHASDFDPSRSVAQGASWTLFVRCLAIVGGIFLLRGANWARWLLVAWLAWHVGLSGMHGDGSGTIAHAALLAAVGYLLFRREASPFFIRPGPASV